MRFGCSKKPHKQTIIIIIFLFSFIAGSKESKCDGQDDRNVGIFLKFQVPTVVILCSTKKKEVVHLNIFLLPHSSSYEIFTLFKSLQFLKFKSYALHNFRPLENNPPSPKISSYQKRLLQKFYWSKTLIYLE